VLRAYARGVNVADIPGLVDGVGRSEVAAILSAADVGMSRQRAAAHVRAHDARQVAVDPVAAVAEEIAPAPPSPLVVVPPVRRLQETQEVATSGIEALLVEAERSTNRKIVTAGGKVRTLVDQLRADLAADRQRTEAEAEVKRLRAALAAAEKRLRGADTGRARTLPPTSGDGFRTADVRAWAAENGVDCPAMGRLPRAVVERYKAANGVAP
jgi:hypothetical protein